MSRNQIMNVIRKIIITILKLLLYFIPFFYSNSPAFCEEKEI